MKIRRVILEGVNNFERFDRTFEFDWGGDEVPDPLLLIGPNGSGKTTLLNVMAGLWDVFRRWIESPSDRTDILDLSTPILPDCQWAAIELIGLEKDQPLWVFYGRHTARDWTDAQQKTYRVGIGVEDVRAREFRRLGLLPGQSSILNPHFCDWSWADEWRQRLAGNILGKYTDLPNVVFIEGEDRKVPRIEEPFQVVREPQEFRWLARYEPTASRKGSLENYLYNLSAVDRPTLEQILDRVNAFLGDKRIIGFDKKTSALMVEVNGGNKHTIDLLSSGEKQMLLLITFITRWLRPGGIVLIDEPDLHIHISWISALVSLLSRMVAEQDGQLIIASHESSLWRRFTQTHLVRLGFPDRTEQ